MLSWIVWMTACTKTSISTSIEHPMGCHNRQVLCGECTQSTWHLFQLWCVARAGADFHLCVLDLGFICQIECHHISMTAVKHDDCSQTCQRETGICCNSYSNVPSPKEHYIAYTVNWFSENCSREKHLEDRLAECMHVVLFRISFAVKRSDRGKEPFHLDRVYCTFTACWQCIHVLCQCIEDKAICKKTTQVCT